MGMSIVIAIVAAVAVIAVIAYFVKAQHPEEAASHGEPEREGSALFHGSTHDRPGGPGSEADGVPLDGQPAPGPSAEQSLGPQFDQDDGT
jgi:hypothetical protein